MTESRSVPSGDAVFAVDASAVGRDVEVPRASRISWLACLSHGSPRGPAAITAGSADSQGGPDDQRRVREVLPLSHHLLAGYLILTQCSV